MVQNSPACLLLMCKTILHIPLSPLPRWACSDTATPAAATAVGRCSQRGRWRVISSWGNGDGLGVILLPSRIPRPLHSFRLCRVDPPQIHTLIAAVTRGRRLGGWGERRSGRMMLMRMRATAVAASTAPSTAAGAAPGAVVTTLMRFS